MKDTNKARRPMYQVIFDDMKGKIVRGELKPGDTVLTQIELAKQYETSEITSRRALTELAKEGFIHRTRGRGTFVSDNLEIKDGERSGGTVSSLYFVYRGQHHHTFNHPFYMNMLEGIELVCRENDIPFGLWSLDEEWKLPDDNNVVYVIITHVPGGDRIPMERLEQWKEENRRMATMHFYYPHLQIPYVVVDNLTGGFLATQHLLSLGHRKVGIIVTGKNQMETNQEFSLRLQGYRLALSQYNISVDPEWICFVDGDQELEQMGYDGFGRLMDSANPPTAIFATSDYKAIGAMKAAKERGLEIPRDVSIVGYDNVQVSQYTVPPLTTISQNTFTLGRRAAEIVLLEWQEAKANLKDEIVPTLIVRKSTREINNN